MCECASVRSFIRAHKQTAMSHKAPATYIHHTAAYQEEGLLHYSSHYSAPHKHKHTHRISSGLFNPDWHWINVHACVCASYIHTVCFAAHTHTRTPANRLWEQRTSAKTTIVARACVYYVYCTLPLLPAIFVTVCDFCVHAYTKQNRILVPCSGDRYVGSEIIKLSSFLLVKLVEFSSSAEAYHKRSIRIITVDFALITSTLRSEQGAKSLWTKKKKYEQNVWSIITKAKIKFSCVRNIEFD